jgi:hypothetical protein
VGTVVVIALVVLVLWILSSLIWPYTSCASCKGVGKFRSPGGRHWRDCPTCRGKGKRRRVLSYLRRDL